VFDVPFGAITAILGRSTAAGKMLASRAHRRRPGRPHHGGRAAGHGHGFHGHGRHYHGDPHADRPGPASPGRSLVGRL